MTIITTVEQGEQRIREIMQERGRWQKIKRTREGRVEEAERFIVEMEAQVEQVQRVIDEINEAEAAAAAEREATRYDFFQRTDWRGIYRYDRKLDGFLIVRSETDRHEYPIPTDPMCDAGRIARMLKDDPYAASFLDSRLRDFAAWIIAVQRTKW